MVDNATAAAISNSAPAPSYKNPAQRAAAEASKSADTPPPKESGTKIVGRPEVYVDETGAHTRTVYDVVLEPENLGIGEGGGVVHTDNKGNVVSAQLFGETNQAKTSQELAKIAESYYRKKTEAQERLKSIPGEIESLRNQLPILEQKAKSGGQINTDAYDEAYRKIASLQAEQASLSSEIPKYDSLIRKANQVRSIQEIKSAEKAVLSQTGAQGKRGELVAAQQAREDVFRSQNARTEANIIAGQYNFQKPSAYQIKADWLSPENPEQREYTLGFLKENAPEIYQEHKSFFEMPSSYAALGIGGTGNKAYDLGLVEGGTQNKNYLVELGAGSERYTLTWPSGKKVENLTAEQIAAYERIFAEKNKQAQLDREEYLRQRKEIQSTQKPQLDALKNTLKYYKAFGIKEITITSDQGTRTVPVASAYREIYLAAKNENNVTYSPIFKNQPKEQIIGYKQDLMGKVMPVYGVPSEQVQAFQTPLSIEGNKLTGLGATTGGPALVTMGIVPETVEGKKYKQLNEFTKKFETSVAEEKNILVKSGATAVLESYSAIPSTLFLAETGREYLDKFITGFKSQREKPLIPETPGLELIGTTISETQKQVEGGSLLNKIINPYRVSKEKAPLQMGYEAVEKYAKREGILPTVAGLAALFLPIPGSSKLGMLFKLRKGVKPATSAEVATVKTLGNLPEKMRLQGYKPSSLNDLYKETPSLIPPIKKELAQAKEQMIAQNIMRAEIEKFQEAGASKIAVRYNPLTEKIQGSYVSIPLGKGEGFMTKGGGFGKGEIPPAPPTMKIISEEIKPKTIQSPEKEFIDFVARQTKAVEHAAAIDLRGTRVTKGIEQLPWPFRAKMKLGLAKETITRVPLGKAELEIAKSKIPQLTIKKIKSPIVQKTKKTSGVTKLGMLEKKARLGKSKPSSLNELYRETPIIGNIKERENLAKIKEQNVARNVIKNKIDELISKGASRVAVRYNPFTEKIQGEYVTVPLGKGRITAPFKSQMVSLGKSKKAGMVSTVGTATTVPLATIPKVTGEELQGNQTESAAPAAPVLTVVTTPQPSKQVKGAIGLKGMPLLLPPKLKIEEKKETLKLDINAAEKERLKNAGFTETKVKLGTGTYPERTPYPMFRSDVLVNATNILKTQSITKRTAMSALKTTTAQVPKALQIQQTIPQNIQKRKQRTTTITIPRLTQKNIPLIKTEVLQKQKVETITIPKLKITPEEKTPPAFPPLFPKGRGGKESHKAGKVRFDNFIGNTRQYELLGMYNRTEIITGIKRTARLARKDVLATAQRRGLGKFVKSGTAHLLKEKSNPILNWSKEEKLKQTGTKKGKKGAKERKQGWF